MPLCNLKVHYCVHNSLQRRDENVPKNLVVKPEGKEAAWEMKVSSEGSCGIITSVEEIGDGNVD